MLVRVCSASAPVGDSLYLGATPNLAFLQMNPGDMNMVLWHLVLRDN